MNLHPGDMVTGPFIGKATVVAISGDRVTLSLGQQYGGSRTLILGTGEVTKC